MTGKKTGRPKAAGPLAKPGRTLITLGAAVLLLLCAYELTIRWQDFDAWLSGIRTMSRAKNESFIANLRLIFTEPKMRSMLLVMLFLAVGTAEAILGLIPRKGVIRCAFLIALSAVMIYAGLAGNLLSFSGWITGLRLIPIALILVGCVLLLLSRAGRSRDKQPPESRVEKAVSAAVKDGGQNLKVMVSACLIGRNCKYSGGNNLNENVMRFLDGKQIIPICPEVMGGLTVPREPCELRYGKAVDRTGRVVDEYLRKGAMKCIALARQEKVNLVILKENSPSCGIRQVYDGSFTGKLVPGRGIFADMVVREGIPVLSEKDFGDFTQNEP